MEESELHEVLHHTLANVDGKAYRTMMSQIFSQRISPAIDYTYDSDMLKVCKCSGDVWVWLFSLCWIFKKYAYMGKPLACLSELHYLNVHLPIGSHLKLQSLLCGFE